MPHFRPSKPSHKGQNSKSQPSLAKIEFQSSESEQNANHGGEVEEGDDGQDVDSDASSDSSADVDEGKDARELLNKVSFGQLVKAQESLGTSGRKRKRGEEANDEHEAKLDAIRERLREIRERNGERSEDTSKGRSGEKHDRRKTAAEDVHARRHGTSFEDEDANSDSETDADDDSDSDPSSSPGTSKHKRSSKHAPTAMPANRAVRRHRTVIEVPTIKSRDPRFDPTSGHLDRNALQSRYSFLTSYQADELTALKKALKDPKANLTIEQREKLQRKAVSLESKISANQARSREEKVRREHRQKERDAVAQGKKPFFLKKSDVKKQALTERFEGMKSRQKDKVIQRRRKKLASKERKSMPLARRA